MCDRLLPMPATALMEFLEVSRTVNGDSENYGEYGFTKDHLTALVKLQVGMDHTLARIERFELRIENRLTTIENNLASKRDLDKLESEIRDEIKANREDNQKRADAITAKTDRIETDLRSLQKEVWRWSGFAALVGTCAAILIKLLWK